MDYSKCPQCSLHTRLNVVGYEENCQVVQYYCINPQCPNGKFNAKELSMPFAAEKKPLQPYVAGSEAKMCCGQLIAYITGDSYHVAQRSTAGAALNAEGTLLTVHCPVCKAAHTYDIKGKQRVE